MSFACDDCKTCKKFVFQSGSCSGKNKKCNGFELEPRGKKIRSSMKLDISQDRSGPIIKYGAYITLVEANKETEVEVIKINYVDLENMHVGLDICFLKKICQITKKEKGLKLLTARE